MSYTPSEQEIETPIDNAISALDALSAAMRARIDDSDWGTEHKRMLRDRIMEIETLRFNLRTLGDS